MTVSPSVAAMLARAHIAPRSTTMPRTAGSGASAISYGAVRLEMEAIDSGWRTFVSVQGSLAMTAMSAIARFGSGAQKRRWLPAMAAGEVIGCFALAGTVAFS